MSEYARTLLWVAVGGLLGNLIAYWWVSRK